LQSSDIVSKWVESFSFSGWDLFSDVVKFGDVLFSFISKYLENTEVKCLLKDCNSGGKIGCRNRLSFCQERDD
jgi:hypothetical protein